MSWFLDLKIRYAPNMTPREFSDLLDKITDKVFKKHPKLQKLDTVLYLTPEEINKLEKEQNYHIEQALRRYVK